MKKIFILSLCTIMIQTTLLFSASHNFAPDEEEDFVPQRTISASIKNPKPGSIVAFTGSMRSEKSAQLVRIVKRCQYSGQQALAFKPRCDNRNILGLERDPRTYIGSRNGNWIECFPVTFCKEIEEIIQTHDDKTPDNKPSVVVFDEAMLFEETNAFCNLLFKLRKEGRDVFVSGLDTNYLGKPFGTTMPMVLAIANEIKKLKSICSRCRTDTYCLTQLLVKPNASDSTIMIGDSMYEPRCPGCHECPKE